MALPSANSPAGSRKAQLARGTRSPAAWTASRGVRSGSRRSRSTTTPAAPGSADHRKMRSGASPSAVSAAASPAPNAAPAWSMPRWKPNASPRRSGGIAAASSASRGLERRPLPTRSTARTSTGCQASVTKAMQGRASAASV